MHAAIPKLPAVSDELLRELDIPGPRYTSYPTVPRWSEKFQSDEFLTALRAAGAERPTEPLSLYVHIPFCRELCSYCGCNVVVGGSSKQADRYLDAIAKEVALARAALGERGAVARIHWGGGTPTFLDEAQIRRLWHILTDAFHLVEGAEVAIEVDPVITRRSQIELLARLGFRRLSLGVQDFDPAVQTAISRIQTVAETADVVELARAVGFESVNFDLIYGLPLQTPTSWAHTIEKVLELRPDRTAVYSFAHIPEARPHQRKLRQDAIPMGAAKLELFRVAHDLFVAAGYEPIGMDHFARAGDELAAARREQKLWRDFQGYTVWRSAESLAFGITGISNLGGAYAQTTRSLSDYYDAVDGGRLATVRGLMLSPDDRRRAEVITDIMCNFEVDLGPDAASAWRRELTSLAALADQGLVTLAGPRLTVTPLGKLFVRNVAMVFDAHLSETQARGATFSRTV